MAGILYQYVANRIPLGVFGHSVNVALCPIAIAANLVSDE